MAMIAERCGMYFSAMNTSSVYISSPECKSHQSCMYTGIATACQGVVTYMSRVEAFATGIKTESSDQGPFEGPIKRSRQPPNC